MKKYIVNQSFRCYYKPDGDIKSNKVIDRYGSKRFSKDVLVGTYTEQEFLALVGEQFFTSDNFKRYSDCGFFKIINEQDITEKTAKKYNSLD